MRSTRPPLCYAFTLFWLSFSLLPALAQFHLQSRWALGEGMTTIWPVARDTNLPHGDFIEQGGLRCGQVVDYHIDGERRLSMKRGVVWPCLRIIPMTPPAASSATMVPRRNRR